MVMSDKDLRTIKEHNDASERLHKQMKDMNESGGSSGSGRGVTISEGGREYLAAVMLAGGWLLGFSNHMTNGNPDYKSVIVISMIVALFFQIGIIRSFVAATGLTYLFVVLPVFILFYTQEWLFPFGAEMSLFGPLVVGVIWVIVKKRRHLVK